MFEARFKEVFQKMYTIHKNLSRDFLVIASRQEQDANKKSHKRFFLYPEILKTWFKIILFSTFSFPLVAILKEFNISENTARSLVVWSSLVILLLFSYVFVMKFIENALEVNNRIHNIVMDVFLSKNKEAYQYLLDSVACVSIDAENKKSVTPKKLRPMVYAYKQGSIQETLHNIAIVNYLIDIKNKKIKHYHWLIIWLPIIISALLLLILLMVFQITTGATQAIYPENTIVFNYPFPFVWMAIFWAITSFIYVKFWIIFLTDIAKDIEEDKYKSYLDGFPRRVSLYSYFEDKKVLELFIEASRRAELFMEKMIGIGLVNFLVVLQISVNT